MKKTCIFIVVVLILLSGLGIFRMINKELSKEEFIALMNSFKQVSNVKMEGRDIIYKKDEYMLSIREDGLHMWGNYKTSEGISYIPNEKIYAFVDNEHSDSVDWEKTEYTFIRI